MRFTMGRRGRDIDDPNYVFSTDGGTWHGSTFTLQGRGYPRQARVFAEHCDLANTWQLAIALDEDAYRDFGPVVSTNGLALLRP